MDMALRWFGSEFDTVSLKHIAQIPGVKGVVTSLTDLTAGEKWPIERVVTLNKEITSHGLKLLAIESVNVHDSIKSGSSDRDFYIERYIETLKILSSVGVKVVCYNFMPIFDWTRTDLAAVRKDGSTVLSYDQTILDSLHPENMLEEMGKKSNKFLLPGWEKERLGKIKELFALYESVDEETLYNNLIYFLKAIMPTCDEYDITMAIHPDDPPWSVFGLPRIVKHTDDLLRIVQAIDNPHNAITLCSGSLGGNPENDIVDTIYALKGRIAFAHIRNVRHTTKGVFEECAHYEADGSLPMFEIIKALQKTGFDGVMRPDHGRAIWDEHSLPGYGLYDRALGVMYLLGLWDALKKGI